MKIILKQKEYQIDLDEFTLNQRKQIELGLGLANRINKKVRWL